MLFKNDLFLYFFSFIKIEKCNQFSIEILRSFVDSNIKNHNIKQIMTYVYVKLSTILFFLYDGRIDYNIAERIYIYHTIPYTTYISQIRGPESEYYTFSPVGLIIRVYIIKKFCSNDFLPRVYLATDKPLLH